MTNLMYALGLSISAATLVSLFWSIAFPEKRLWPPHRYTWRTPWLVWTPTVLLTLSLIGLGVANWNDWGWSASWRYALGGTLILLGNAGVWFHVWVFGVHKTGGQEGHLETRYLYRYSRNPQYISDVGMIIGWILMSANVEVLLVGVFAVSILVIAPFAEEPWLEQRYGTQYQAYKKKTPRFL